MASGRQTLSQRIALDGGKEIKAELEALGKSGSDAFKKLEQAARASALGGSALGKSLKDLSASFDQLKNAGARLGRDIQGLNQAAGRFGNSVATVGRRVAVMTAAVAAGATAAVALGASWVKAGAEAADAAGKAAQEVGLSIESYTALQFAAEQSGASASDFGTAMNRLNKSINDAAEGNKNAVALFQNLGVSIKDANGQIRPTEDLLKDVADAFARMPDGARKSALAIELLGRSGTKLLPFLNNARSGLEALMKQAVETGVVFTAAQFKMAERMNDSLSAMRKAIGATRAQLGLLFAPIVTAGSDRLTAIINKNRAAIVAYGETIRDYLIERVIDFIHLFRGEDNLVEARWLVDAKNGILEFADTVEKSYYKIIAPAFDRLMKGLEAVAGVINRTFGTDITGKQLAFALAIGKILGVFGLLVPGTLLVVAAFKTLAASFVALSAAVGVLGAGLRVILTGMAGLLGWPVLIAAAIGAAALLIYRYWDDIKAGAAGVWKFLTQLFSGDFAGAWETMKAGFAAAWDDILQNGYKSWTAMAAGAILVWRAFAGAFGLVKVGALFAGVGATARTAFIGAFAGAKMLAAIFGTAAAGSAIGAAFLKLGAAAVAALGGFFASPVAIAAFVTYLVVFFRESIGEALSQLAGWAQSRLKELFSSKGPLIPVPDTRDARKAVDDLGNSLGELENKITSAASNLRTLDGDPLVLANRSAEEWNKRAIEVQRSTQALGAEVDKLDTSRGFVLGVQSAEDWNRKIKESVKSVQPLTEIGPKISASLDAINLSKISDGLETNVKQALDTSEAATTESTGKIESAFERAWNAIKSGMGALWQEFGVGSAKAAEDVTRNLDAIQQVDLTPIKTAFDGLSEANPFATLLASAREAFEAIKAEAATAAQFVFSAFSAGGEQAGGLVQWAQATAAQIVAAFSTIPDAIRDVFNLLPPAVDTTMQAITSAVDAMVAQVSSALDALARRIAEVAAAASAASFSAGGGGGGSSPEGFASGGYVRGAGTSTSDSILSWLSNGEYVIRTAAVRKFGPAFFAALNQLRLPKFNTGGLVGAFSMPSMALSMPSMSGFDGGGGNLAPVTLNIGGEAFEGFMAPPNVIGTVAAFASRSKMRSAGRKPSHYGAY